MLDLGQAEGPSHDGRTSCPGRIHIPTAQLKVLRNVGSGLGEDEIRYIVLLQIGVEQRGVLLGCFYWIKDCGKRLVFHLHQLRCFMGSFLAARDDARDWFANVAHSFTRKDRAVDKVETYVVGHVGAGDHSLDAW